MIFRHCKKKKKSIHDSAMEITANTPRHHCYPQIKKKKLSVNMIQKMFYDLAVYAPIQMA